MLQVIKSIYGIQRDLSEEQALEIVRASVETNRHLCRLVSALRGANETRPESSAEIPADSASNRTRSTAIEMDSPAEALQILVDRAQLSRGDAEQLTPILLGLHRKQPSPVC